MLGVGGNKKRIEENSFGQNPLEEFSFYNATDRMKNVFAKFDKRLGHIQTHVAQCYKSLRQGDYMV